MLSRVPIMLLILLAGTCRADTIRDTVLQALADKVAVADCANNPECTSNDADCSFGYTTPDTGGDTGGTDDPPPDPEPKKCFPANGKVLLANHTYATMDTLRVGDLVQTADPFSGQSRFSPVVAFLHVDRQAKDSYVRITLGAGTHLTLSPDHTVFVADYETGQGLKNVNAKHVAPGHWMQVVRGGDMHFAKVEAVARVKGVGLFAPMTLDGTIVVDGVLVSCYAVTGHAIAHFILAPIRWEAALGWNAETGSLPQDGIHWWAKILYGVASKLVPLSVWDLGLTQQSGFHFGHLGGL